LGITKCVAVSLGVDFPAFRKNAVPSSDKGQAVQQVIPVHVNSQQHSCEKFISRISHLQRFPDRCKMFHFHQSLVNPQVADG